MDHWNGVRTALSIASEQGNLASIGGLLEYASIRDLQDVQNSNVNFADEEGRSPISYAAGNGHFEITKLLLQHGANALLPDLYGRTPLSWAAGGGHFSTVDLFLSPKYNINANSQDGLGQTPFFWACANGHSQIVAMMLARDEISPAYPSDYKGNSPLAAAAANGRESVIKILLTYQEVIQDWVVTNWKEEMAKDEWKSNNPGVWSFHTTIAWDHTVSLLPQNKAMAHGHWDIAKLLRLHWEGLDMKRYRIADNVKAEFKETTTNHTNNLYLTNHVYDPSGSGSFFYPYEQAVCEFGMPASSEESATTTNNAFTREYDPLRASYPYEHHEHAAGDEVGMPPPAHDQYSPSDHGFYYYASYGQTAAAAAAAAAADDGGFEAEVVVPASYYYNAQSSTRRSGEGPTGEDINYYHDDDDDDYDDDDDDNNHTNDNYNNDTPTQQPAITKKHHHHHRKRYKKSKVINVHVAKKEQEEKEKGEKEAKEEEEEEEEEERGATAESKSVSVMKE